MTHLLREGSKGDEVKAIQEALNLHPLGLKQPLVADGKFGRLTKAAVIAFQARKSLVPDGIVGPLTLAALYPFGAYHLKVNVATGSGSPPAPQTADVSPILHPAGPVTTGRLPGLSTPLPMPLVPAPPAPAPSPAQPSQSVQVKAGEQTSIPIRQFPAPSKPSPITHTLTIDWIGLIYTPKSFHVGPLSGPASGGIDLGVGVPVSDGAKFTATASWSATFAPDLFRFKRWDLLAFSAKAGLGVVGQNAQPSSFLSASASLALSMSYDLISGQPGEPSLKISVQNGFSGSLDHRDSKFHLTTTLPISGNIVYSF